jgi:methylmalonyl-CoA/ethylmalonyl-CoA epimerase
MTSERSGFVIGRLNHVAIAVRDAIAASAVYHDVLEAKVSALMDLPEHGVRVLFVELPNTKIEFVEPLSPDSPVAKFLDRNPGGGIHHLCFEVDDILAAREQLRKTGVRVLGDGSPKTGAHGKPVLFLNPKDCAGTLIELEEA